MLRYTYIACLVFFVSLYLSQGTWYSVVISSRFLSFLRSPKRTFSKHFSHINPVCAYCSTSWSYVAVLTAKWRVVNTKILSVSSILGWLTGKYFQTFWTNVLPSSSESIQSNNMQDVTIFILYLMAGAEPSAAFFVFLMRDQTMRNFQYLWVFTYNLCHQPRLAPTQYKRHSMGTLISLIYFSVFVNSARRWQLSCRRISKVFFSPVILPCIFFIFQKFSAYTVNWILSKPSIFVTLFPAYYQSSWWRIFLLYAEPNINPLWTKSNILFQDLIRTAQWTFSVSVKKTNLLAVYGAKVAVCSATQIQRT